MLRFNDIADRIMEYNPACDLALLQRAYVFTAKVHEGQERLSGEPYLVHPLEVAGILVEMKMDDVTVAAGLLHDAVEDTLTTRGAPVRTGSPGTEATDPRSDDAEQAGHHRHSDAGVDGQCSPAHPRGDV